MPWRDLTVARACNRCRRVLSAGAHVYQGEVTGATWCGDCASAMGKDGLPPINETGRPERMVDALAAQLKALAAKHTRRDLSARILGEGEE